MKRIYAQDELLAETPYARPHEEEGSRLHGGFDGEGNYISPRTLHRWPAVRNWQAALEGRGLPLLDASGALLKRGNYPNFAQQLFLLDNGFGQTFWNSLTVTGIIEARGQALVDYPAPDMQEVIEEDISDTATGHLRKGLLVAHGMDEGGDPDRPEIGAHDRMWFAARDLLFGSEKWPVPEVPASISRPIEARELPQLPQEHESMLLLLTDVLMIEIRAEVFFDLSMRIACSSAFERRRGQADRAAALIERIRQDEAIHVDYLRLVLSELRGMTFKTPDGGVRGAELIDPLWNKMVRWHGETQFDLARERIRTSLRETIGAKGGAALFTRFEALDDRPQAA